MNRQPSLFLVRPGTMRRVFNIKPRRLLHQNTTRRANTSHQSGSAGGGKEPLKQSRIRYLASKYGYSALGIYLGISVIDLAVTFGLVHSLGKEKIEKLQDEVKDYFGIPKDSENSKKESIEDKYGGRIDMSEDEQGSNTPMISRKDTSRGSSTLLAEIAVAFAIHKSLIFLRVPLTVAITPPIVKTLQRWGYNVGKSTFPTRVGSTMGTKSTAGQRFGSWFF